MKAGLLRTNAFWAEMAPGEHLVQIYGEDLRFLDALGSGTLRKPLRSTAGLRDPVQVHGERKAR